MAQQIKATYITGYTYGEQDGQVETATITFDNAVDYQLWATKMDKRNEWFGGKIDEIIFTEWVCK